MCSLSPWSVRIPALVLLACVGLAACSSGDDDGPEPTAASPTATTPTGPTETAEPAGPDRSPEALMAQLEFTAPPFEDPMVQEAVDGYEDYLRQLMVAQGLSDADYPPLLATIEPGFVQAALQGTTQNETAGAYLVGPYIETVIEGAGSEGQVFLTSCADLSAREGFALDTGELLLEAAPEVIPATVTMIRAAEGWVLSGYLRNEELVCP